MKVPILKGNNVILKGVEVNQAGLFLSWFKDKKVTRYLIVPNIKTLAEEKKWILGRVKAKDKIFWSIWLGKKVIGNCILRLGERDKSAELGIVIGDKSEWGHGYAPEAIRLLENYVFDKLKFNRFSLVVCCEHTRGIKAYKKVGFKIEGTLRQSHWSPIIRKFEDQFIMSILKDEWIKKNKK